jgi:tetratricopeptide (TPR) repeat protein
VEDFTVVVKEMPGYADAWMRRAQARAALGEDEDALADLDTCLGLAAGERPRQADARLERAKIFQKRRDFRRAVAELQRSVELNPDNLQVRPRLSASPENAVHVSDFVPALAVHWLRL